MHYAINYTGNSKTGVIPVTTSSKTTCPDTCSLKEKGCYAKYSFLGNYWNKLTEGNVKGSLDWLGLMHSINRLDRGQLWRMNQAGDLPHNNGTLSNSKLNALIQANRDKRGFTYTHHDVKTNLKNRRIIDGLNRQGFTVNLSADSEEVADLYTSFNIAPVVVLKPIGSDKVSYTPAGNKIVLCPANKAKGITCANCQLCSIADRDYIIGFEVHGTAKKSLHCNLISVTNI